MFGIKPYDVNSSNRLNSPSPLKNIDMRKNTPVYISHVRNTPIIAPMAPATIPMDANCAASAGNISMVLRVTITALITPMIASIPIIIIGVFISTSSLLFL